LLLRQQAGLRHRKGTEVTLSAFAESRLWVGSEAGLRIAALVRAAFINRLENQSPKKASSAVSYSSRILYMPRGNPSPKIAITVDPNIHENILAAAARDGVSVSAWMSTAAR
jgi:predicted HicB family RNase H-like nuclease